MYENYKIKIIHFVLYLSQWEHIKYFTLFSKTLQQYKVSAKRGSTSGKSVSTRSSSQKNNPPNSEWGGKEVSLCECLSRSVWQKGAEELLLLQGSSLLVSTQPLGTEAMLGNLKPMMSSSQSRSYQNFSENKRKKKKKCHFTTHGVSCNCATNGNLPSGHQAEW